MNPIHEPITPGPTPDATAYQAERDLDSHGFFLTPLLQPGFDVLDAGCGPATITMGIAESVFPGRVIGMDLDPTRLEFGRRITEGREIMNLDFVNANVYEIPFADYSFDVVFSHALLGQLTDPIRAINEFHRVTRPGGFIAIACADWDTFQIDPLPLKVGRAIEAYRDLIDHYGATTRAGTGLTAWLKQAGFTPLACDTWQEQTDASTIANHLALRLEDAGQFHHASALREWAEQPDARFTQSWKYATAVRADAHRIPVGLLE